VGQIIVPSVIALIFRRPYSMDRAGVWQICKLDSYACKKKAKSSSIFY
jgi:hypothetical protein